MYDRKTWIVVAICSVLLALNLYQSSKTRQAMLEAGPGGGRAAPGAGKDR
jgi:hypothetical protein